MQSGDGAQELLQVFARDVAYLGGTQLMLLRSLFSIWAQV